MPAVGGGGASGGVATSPHGILWFDVRDYGAKADNGVTDNREPFQAAHDALAAKMNAIGRGGITGTVFIPSGDYFMSGPVFMDRAGVTIQGEGNGSVIGMSRPYDAFVVGISRTSPNSIDASYRPDCFGKLDASACPAAGQKFGVATKGLAAVQTQGSPISSGIYDPVSGASFDLYGTVKTLTFEFCIEPPDGQNFPDGATPFSWGSSEGNRPLMNYYFESGIMWVNFNTTIDQDTDLIPSAGHMFSFSVSGQHPLRVAVCFNLNAPAVYAFVNGVQVAITNGANMNPGDTVPLIPGATFIKNELCPFTIGCAGQATANVPCDIRVYGMRMSNTLRYQNRGVGLAQTRTDAGTLNDAWAYFGQDANTVAFLACTDDPATAGILVSFTGGAAAGIYLNGQPSGGYFILAAARNFMGNVTFRDLSIANYNCSACIAHIGALDLVFERITCQGGFNGIANIVCNANYWHLIRDCNISGLDAAFWCTSSATFAENIRTVAGRVMLRSAGSGGYWRNIECTGAANYSEGVIKATAGYGNGYYLENLAVDMEGNTFVPGGCGIYMQAQSATPATVLVMKGVGFGTIGQGNPLVRLRQIAAGADQPGWQGWFDFDFGPPFTGESITLVEVDGPGWYGHVRGNGIGDNTARIRTTGKFGDRTSILCEELGFKGVPAANYWHQGAHVLKNTYAADGQFTELRCVKTGTYGTATPPVWAGANLLTVNPNSLASYGQTHRYSTLALA